jgi:hypothetical protein
MALFNEIERYFEQNADLHVLFIFDVGDRMASELNDKAYVDWDEHPEYHYEVFNGKWFTTKYHIYETWKDKRIVLLFPAREYPEPQKEKELADFPLLDVLSANLKFMPIKWEAYCQQHRLSIEKYGPFIKKHIAELTQSKFEKIFKDSLDPDVFTIDLGHRGLISGFLGEGHLLKWDEIFLRLFIIAQDEKKETQFYYNMKSLPDCFEEMQRHLKAVFGRQYLNTADKMKEVAESLKYNAITQLLSVQNVDPYKHYKVNSSVALEEMNRLLALAQTLPKPKQEAFFASLERLSKAIRVQELINIYGVDAEYYFVPEELCWAIIGKCAGEAHTAEAEHVSEKMQSLAIKQEDKPAVLNAIMFVARLTDYYLAAKTIATLRFNQPNDYVVFYRTTFHKVDTAYRKAVGLFYTISKDTPASAAIDEAKARLDNEYWVLCNNLNVEWMQCVEEKGNAFADVQLKRQECFFNHINVPNLKQVVIISDGLRYEVAQQLYVEMAKSRHDANLDAMLAMLPTETEYTKVALLPHHSLRYSDRHMLVDDQHLGGTSERKKQVQKFVPNAHCVDINEVLHNSKEQNRELVKYDLLVVFQDVIDDTGHKDNPETLTAACEQTISELERVVRKLHDANSNSIWITSDHGFLFNDFDLGDTNKVKSVEDKATILEKKSRYILSTNADEQQHGIMRFPLEQVSAMQGDITVAVPVGAVRVKAPGESYRYAHGGASLQEMIIPVLHSRNKDENKKEKVGVTILGQKLNMVSSRLKFKVIQTEAAGPETNLVGRTIVCAVYDGDTPVTAEKTLLMNSTDSVNFNNRIFEVELTLSKPVTSRLLNLRIYDEKDMLNPLAKANVTNSTIIEQDF